MAYLVDDRTTQRGYRKPSIDNDLETDVERLRLTLEALDTDMANAASTSSAAVQAANGATAAAQDAKDTAQAATGTAQAARMVVGITAQDTTPGNLATKLDVGEGLGKAVQVPGGDERLLLTVRNASTSQTGVVRLATDAEITTGTSEELAVTPRGVSGLLANAATMKRSIRTSNVQLGVGDRGRFIDIVSGSFTQTFAGCATLGDGWFIYLRNDGTGDITLDPNSSDQIDGLGSFKMYPGEARLVQCDGSTLSSIVLQGFTRLFTASNTFVRPPGYAAVLFELAGAAGGGAGGGTRVSSSTFDIYAGGGGGGGARRKLRLAYDEIGQTVGITVGGGGSGGAGAAAGSSEYGAPGNDGGSSAVGSFVEAPGGKGGTPGGNGGLNNGGKGGEHAALAANPRFAAMGSVTAGTAPALPELGGGGGGRSGEQWSAAGPGGRSLEGGPGGGGGGGADPSSGNYAVVYAGAAGGGRWVTGNDTTGGGGSAGGTGGQFAHGGNGGAGSTPSGALFGTGGGGGGAGGERGGDGGGGGRGAGGGGGGTGHNQRGGNGGAGGAGTVRATGVV